MAFVSKLKSKKNQTICSRLFTEGDILFIENPDGKQDKRLSVFNENKELIGSVNSERYYEIIETTETF